MTRRIMHIDLDTFFVSVEQVYEPSLKDKPVVVGGIPGHGRGVVAAASYEARRFGIHSGMSLFEAQRRCPDCIFLGGHSARYRDASQKFMAILADFSPFLEPVGIDEAYLEVTGFESLYGDLRTMGESIRERIRQELHLPASIGLAGSKIVAKIASKAAKPDGMFEVIAGNESGFLAPMPVSSMPGIGRKTQKILRNIGLTTIGEIAHMPASSLKERFGSYGITIKNHAMGIDDREVEPPAAVKSVSHEMTLDKDSRNPELLAANLRYLTEKVAARLRRYNHKGSVIQIRLRYADFTTITRQRMLGFATDASDIIYEEAHQLFRKALNHSRLSVRLIGVGVGNIRGIETQLPLSADARQTKIDQALDIIHQKYGFSSVLPGQLIASGLKSAEFEEASGFSRRIIDS